MMLRFAIFFSTISALVCFLAYKFTIGRLNLNTTGLWVVRAAFIFGWMLLLAAPIHYRSLHPDPAHPFSYLLQTLSYLWLGWVGIYLISAIVIEFVHGVIRVFDPEKRVFLTEGVAKGVLAGVTLGTGVGFLQAKAGPTIEEVQVPLKNLPEAFDGFVITQISDVHIGPLLHRDFAEIVVDRVLQTKPDLIAVTGDIVDGKIDQLKDHVEPFSRLQAPMGTFFVTGNHEYYSGADEWISHFESFGFKTLGNSNHVLEKNSEKILIAGVYDLRCETVHATHKHDPKLAAACDDPNVKTKILLAHQPGSSVDAAEAGFDLQLSGHTHAGQFYPFTFIARLAHRHFKGLNRHDDKMWVYVNKGTGYWGPPNRLGIRSEITKLVLRRA